MLRTATLDLAARLGIDVRVLPLPRHLEASLDGRAGRHWVQYASTAPLATVAHELAHILVPGDEHGPGWRRAFTVLAVALRAAA